MNCDKIDFKLIEKEKNENTNSYHDRAYIVFKKTLIDSNIKYNNMPVKVRDLPYEDNKVQGFFHIISELNKKLGIRMYKDERVKFIPYISKMITEYNKCNTCFNNFDCIIFLNKHISKNLICFRFLFVSFNVFCTSYCCVYSKTSKT